MCHLAEWLYEAGIGENRAALVEHDEIRAVRLERALDGVRHGAIIMARLIEPDIVELDDSANTRASLQGRTKFPLGSRFMVEVVRMALKERGRDKLARVRMAADDAVPQDGLSLLQRISTTEVPVTMLTALTPGVDRLEAAGWSDMIDRAQRGHWAFDGGALWFDPTPAMLVIDMDGQGKALPLARAGAKAACEMIQAFDVGGPIVIDFPSLGSRAERAEVDGLIDRYLPPPFERTGTNGFGLMQIIRRRNRPSVIEQLRYDHSYTDAALLLRQAERAPGSGELLLRARPAVIDLLLAHPQWTEALQHSSGRRVSLQADANMKGAGHAQ